MTSKINLNLKFTFNLKRPSNLDPLFDNYTSNCSLCSTCKEHYVNLTNYFKNMSHERDENNMCMDVVDLVNTKSEFKILINSIF
jgi:hypothetical protein